MKKLLILLLGAFTLSATAQTQLSQSQVKNLVTDLAGKQATITLARADSIINAANAAWFGDSLTAGVGAPDNTIPVQFANSTGLNTFNYGISGQTSTQIYTRYRANAPPQKYMLVIWWGRNDISISSDTASIHSNWTKFKQHQDSIGNSRYIVIGVIKRRVSTEYSATTIGNLIDGINVKGKAIFGTHWINADSIIINAPHLVPQDAIDQGHGVGVFSARAVNDSLHLNGYGYSLINNAVIAKSGLYQSSLNHVLTVADAPALSPAAPLTYTLANGGKYLIGGQQVLYLPSQSTNSGSLIIGDNGLAISGATGNTGIGLGTFINLISGARNTATGQFALSQITTPNDNTAFGYGALANNITATGNTAFGSSALTVATAAGNSGFGFQALKTLSTGTNNTAVGQNALFTASSSSSSVGIGFGALQASNGTGNIGIGYQAGLNFTGTGAQNIIIGYNISFPSTSAGGQLNIGNAIFGTANTGTGTTVSTGGIGIYTTSPNSSFQITGSLSLSYVAKTANYTLTGTDYLVKCTANSFTTTLPTAVGCTGRIYVIKNTGAGTITLATTSSQTIDGAAPGTVAAGGVIRLMSDGANWISI